MSDPARDDYRDPPDRHLAADYSDDSPSARWYWFWQENRAAIIFLALLATYFTVLFVVGVMLERR